MPDEGSKQEAAHTRRPVARAGDLFLPSKITVPGMPQWAVQRPRITKLIAEGTRWCPLTVITGPAGAGKSMALALWAAAEAGPVAWVCVDESDNWPGVFWSCVVAALRRAGVAVPRTLPPATRDLAADHAFLLRLVTALAAQDPPVTLVLDDLHELTEPKLLHDLDFVLRNAGPGLRMVVASRMDPMLRLHRYRLAGQLAEIRAGHLAFTVGEASQLMAQHGSRLSAGSVECLTRRTEGWAAGLRLAAISMDAHPDPDQFVTGLAAEESVLTGYVIAEILNAQPPVIRDVLLSTSVLEQVSADLASELSGTQQAAEILPELARANAFVQPLGNGWYRYHTLFAEVLRLKLRREDPRRATTLHLRAARWYAANGQLTHAVRHAAQAGDWPLAARLVVGAMAIDDIVEPCGSQPLARELREMPHCQDWNEPAPYLVTAATALAGGQHESSAAALAAAERILGQLPDGQQAAARLAAALMRLAMCRRTGNLTAAARAAAHAESLVSTGASAALARTRAQVLAGRGAVELWSGHFDQAGRVLESAVTTAAAPGAENVRATCLGHLALAEALRGRLHRARELAAGALTGRSDGQQRPSPAAFAALAWVHLQRNDLAEARHSLKQADTALGLNPDRLTTAVACLTAAVCALATGHHDGAGRLVAKARSGWQPPAWLERQLASVQALACVARGDVQAAIAAARQPGHDSSPELAVALAHAWMAAGDLRNAANALAPALAPGTEAPGLVLVHAWLADAQLSHRQGDRTRGCHSLAAALRLAQPEQLRLPLAMQHGRMAPLLEQHPELADAYRHLLTAAPRRHESRPAVSAPRQAAAPVVIEPLTEREREVLRHVSAMMSTAEVASEMYISTNTVKSHLKSIFRKLAAAHRGEAVRRARQLQLI